MARLKKIISAKASPQEIHWLAREIASWMQLIFQNRTGNLKVGFEASILSDLGKLELVEFGLSNQYKEGGKGFPILNKALAGILLSGYAEEIDLEFFSPNLGEIAVTITRRNKGVAKQLYGFILESPDESRIGTTYQKSIENDANTDLLNSVATRMNDLGMFTD
jgi:hypothetical protein